MATLTVTDVHDYRHTPLSNIDTVQFSGSVQSAAIFTSEQFNGPGKISNSVTIVGDGYNNEVDIQIDSGAYFSAANWTIENWTPGNDTFGFTGKSGAETITGTLLNDFFDGAGGADVLHGGGGSDTFQYRASTDVSVGEVIDGGAGSDKIMVKYSSVKLDFSVATISAVETVQLYGDNITAQFSGTQIGTDHINYLYGLQGTTQSFEVDGASVDLSSMTFDSWGAPTQKIYINGTGSADTLTGSTQNDILDGKAGADVMQGLGGDDTYYVDNSADKVVEAVGGGTDSIFASVNYTLSANTEKILANSAGLTLTGNSLANSLYDFAASGSKLVGGAGNDTYGIHNSNSTITEAAGAAGGTLDTVYASVSFDLSTHGANVERLISSAATGLALTGNDLGNTIVGGAGADTLSGKLGLDMLTGGAGADTFVFNTAPSAANFDTITDFSHLDDSISLSKSVFAALTGGVGSTLNASEFHAGLSTAAYQAGDHIIYQTDTGKLFYDVDGYGGAAAVQIALLSTKPQDLAANDFLLIA